MKYYFSLQFKRFLRWLADSGVPAFIALPFLIIAFLAASKWLFIQTAFSSWIYAIVAMFVLLPLSDQLRNAQLKMLFSNGQLWQLRIIENIILVAPFVAYLCFEQQFLPAAGLVPVAALLTRLPTNVRYAKVFPSPFRKFPFEFSVGFRKTAWVLGTAYLLMIPAILVVNYNLGVFALIMIFLTGMSYYLKPESQTYVWIYACSVQNFLLRKMATALICISILSLPMLLIMLMAFPDFRLITLAVQLLGYIFMISVVLAKYSAYPNEMSIPQGILYGVSLTFPLLFLLVIPLFYYKATRKLKPLLE